MFQKIVKCTFGFSFAALLLFLNNGCGNVSRNNKAAQNETQRINPVIIPQYELTETPEYRRLIKQYEQAQIEFYDIEAERSRLFVKYKKEHSLVKKASSDLEKARKKLYQLKTLLAAESKKFEYKPKIPVI